MESTINTKVKIGSTHKEKAAKVTDGLIGALYGEHVSDNNILYSLQMNHISIASLTFDAVFDAFKV